MVCAVMLVVLSTAAWAGTISAPSSPPTANVIESYTFASDSSGQLSMSRAPSLNRVAGQSFKHDTPFTITAITFDIYQINTENPIPLTGTHVVQMALMEDTDENGDPDTQVGDIELFDAAGKEFKANEYVTFTLDSETAPLDANKMYSLQFWWTTDDAANRINARRSHDDPVNPYPNGALVTRTGIGDEDFPLGEGWLNTEGRDMPFVLQGNEVSAVDDWIMFD